MNTGLKSQKSTKELKDRTSVHYCNVIRNGKIEHINTNDLVVGDLVIIQSGEAIHADGYLVEGNIKVDNSVLNGESEPCKKTAWDKEDSPIAFGGEPAKDEYMKEKPIPKGSKLLSKETIGQIAVSVVAFIGIFGITLLPPVQKILGNNEAVYATVRFALLIMMATFNGFNIRTDGFNLFKGIGKNKLFIEIAVVIFALTFVLAQFGGDIMECTAMTPTQWGVTVVLAFMIIPIDLVRKAVIKIKRK